MVIAAESETFLALSAGRISAQQATARGASIQGDPAAVERMTQILPRRDGRAADTAPA